MQLVITGKNVQVPMSLRTYTENKINKLDRYLPSLSDARVVYSKEQTKSANQTHVVRVTLHANRTYLRGAHRASEFSVALDRVLEKIYKEIDRAKGKRDLHRKTSPRLEEKMLEPARRRGRRIVRRKQFATPPLTEKQAIKAMNELGHDFYMFLNRANGLLSVLYRRKDGNYGVIEPETQG